MKLLKIAKVAALAGVMACSLNANAAKILFAHVDNYGSYVDDGNRIAGFLSSAGHNVTIRHLDQAVFTDYASFDQVFVYDLYSSVDKNANQRANYANIANWYNGLSDQNLILDGRIISSDVWWTDRNNLGGAMPSEAGWIQNYATQLDLRGGGLVLGTDHNAFQSGINDINAGIGINLFHGNYYPGPYSQAVVDTSSQLGNVPGLADCRADPTLKCINDNSSTGFVATGLQANGQTLTPVAYHGNNLDAWQYAAISSTIGSITFGTCGDPGQPPCQVSVSEPSHLAMMGLALLGLAGLRRRVRS